MPRSFKGQRSVFKDPRRRPTVAPATGTDPSTSLGLGFQGPSAIASGQAPGFQLQAPPTYDFTTVQEQITAGLSEEVGRREELIQTLRQGEDVPMPLALRQQLEQIEAEAEVRLEEINESISVLNRQEEAIEDVFDVGSLFLESQGIPATVEDVKENPVVDKAMKQVTTAILTDDPELLDEAIDALATLSEGEMDAIEHAYGRQRFFADLQTGIRTQMHNLVQERQDLQASLIEAEDWVEREAEAQQLNLWDVSADVRPTARGLDVLVGGVEPWLEANFNGIISDTQAGTIANTLQQIWEVQPSVGETVTDPVTGEEVERPSGLDISIDTEQGPIPARQLLFELARTVLGFSEQKTLKFVDQVETALTNGKRAAEIADDWENQDILTPGGPDMATGIAEVATDLYDDPETVNLMANSYYLHRLIDARSGGDTNTSKGGNLFGLGALPEYTYEDMGYSIDGLTGNPKEQLEALLVFIGMKFGPGYEGLQIALSEWVHSPDTWGDLPAGGL